MKLMYVYGFDYLISPSDSQYTSVGMSMLNSMVTKSSDISQSDLDGAQRVLDNWGQQLARTMINFMRTQIFPELMRTVILTVLAE